jgi:hypothetical protein
MLHVVKQIEERFPTTKDRVIPFALAISAFAVAIGLVLLLVR